jgi:putative transposase
MNLTYTYRLYPNRIQTESLNRVLDSHRELYNAALEERREAWRRSRVSINYYDQANQLKEIRQLREDLALLNFSLCQQTLRRLSKAFDGFFRRIKSGETPGYPRFQSRSRFNSVAFVFGDGAALLNGRLKIQGVGVIKVKWHREIVVNAEIKQVVIKRKGDQWYAHLQLELPEPTPEPHSGEPVGIDLGLIHFAALSNGETVETPRHFRQAEHTLRIQQRRVSRRQKFSHGWRKAQKQTAKTHERIANRRKDFTHKLSTRLVKEFSLIALEDLNVKGLSRSRLAKSVNDAAWSQFVNQLEYKVQQTGAHLAFVDPRHTSQACSVCGCIINKDLNVRVHSCPNCGLVLDRDVNAARCILKSALGRSADSITWAATPCVLSEAVAL